MGDAYRMADPLLEYYIFALLAFYPAMRIFNRAGMAPTGALWLALPWIGFVAIAVKLAFGKWTRVAPLKEKKQEDAV